MNEKDNFYLKNILDSILDIEKFLIGMNKTSFFASDLHQSAVIKKLEVIGEAAKRVGNELKNKHKDIEWRKVAGMRDVLIHDYLGVDLEEVWNTVTVDIPIFKKQIKSIIE